MVRALATSAIVVLIGGLDGDRDVEMSVVVARYIWCGSSTCCYVSSGVGEAFRL